MGEATITNNELQRPAGWFVAMAAGGPGGWPQLTGWAVLGAVYGVITGLVLVRMFRQPLPDFGILQDQ
jgi:hypothetical protein